MNLLVFNCGSSSQGFSLFSIEGEKIARKAAFGKAHSVATPTKAASVLEWTLGSETGAVMRDLSSHRLAAEAIIDWIHEKKLAVDGIAHRFVHGGAVFQRAVRIDALTAKRLKDCFPLAPIHNPNSYSVIEACMEAFPKLPEYAVFDTAFHTGMPAAASVYALPKALADENSFRKVGFHGLSYQYVSRRAAFLLQKPLSELKLIMCHLGTGGSSVCAYCYGKSVDSSMGYSPTSGLIMSTRCGDLDPEIVLELIRGGRTPEEVSHILNKESGLLGLSGAYSSDPGEIISAAKTGNAECQLCFEAYVLRLRKYIGAFLYEMNGADALIFTDDGGVRFPEIREAVCTNAEWLGIAFDSEANRGYTAPKESCLSLPESKMSVWVIPTDEEQTIVDEVCLLLERESK